MRFKNFIKECHKMEVFKMLSIYLVTSWVLLQVLAVTWEALGLPKRSVTYLIILLLIGFPVFLFWVWKFQIVPCYKKEDIFEDDKRHKIQGFHKTYFYGMGIIGAICAISVFLIIGNTFSNTSQLPQILQTDKIAVLKFGNNTGDAKYDVVSKMAADWIIHGIAENHLGQVISQDVITQYNDILIENKLARSQREIVREYLKPAKIISGNFYLNNGQLIFQSSISDEKTDKILISFENTPCDASDPVDCVKDITESITGYLATASNKTLMLQETPPKYEAYKFLFEAKNTDDDAEQLALLNKAINFDPNYFEPKVLRVAYYLNQHQYKTADSLLELIKPDSNINFRQLNLLNMYSALLKGDNRKAYDAILKEYKIAPFDLVTNKSSMVLALQYVNRPKDVEGIFEEIGMDSMNFQNCHNCVERSYVRALADVQLEKYDRAITLSQKILNEVDSELLKKPLISAMIRSSRNADLNEFLYQQELILAPQQLHELYILAGKEYLLKYDKPSADIYLNKAKILDNRLLDKTFLAETLFYLRDYHQSESEYKMLFENDPGNIDILGKLILSNFMAGDTREAEKNSQALEQLRGKYQFGEIAYVLAQYYALAQEEDKMYRQLLKSIAEGHLFLSSTFQNDPIFRDYLNTEKFQQTTNYWK